MKKNKTFEGEFYNFFQAEGFDLNKTFEEVCEEIRLEQMETNLYSKTS